MRPSKTRIIAGVFAVSVFIVSTLFISKSLNDPRNLEVTKAHEVESCTPFVVMAKMDTKVECVKGFIEIQEKEDGSTLVVCSCSDPLRCADEKHIVKP